MDFSKLRVPEMERSATEEDIYKWWEPQQVGGPGPKLALLIIAMFQGGATSEELIQLCEARNAKEMERFVRPLLDSGLMVLRT